MCKKQYPRLDFTDAAGAFFPSSEDAKSHTVVFRRNATPETVCHEIGHVIHEFNDPEAYGDGDGRDRKRLGNVLNNTKSKLRKSFASFGVDRNGDKDASEFERVLLKTLDNEYVTERHRLFAEKHAGIVTLFHKVNESVMGANAFGIHYGDDIKDADDPNYKELVANIIGIYLSRRVRVCRFFERFYGVSFGAKDGYTIPQLIRKYLRNVGYSFDWLDGEKP